MRTGTYELALRGCPPVPLGSYLRALGVLRVVGEQFDASATGWWGPDGFRLRSTVDRGELSDHFLRQYRPTPVVAPWNKGSGFKVAGNPAAVEALSRIESSTDPRLADYRAAIVAGRRVLVDAAANGWDKRTIVEACRTRFADEAVAWVDTSVVLAGGEAHFPPLLGTGGNDGRFDFSIAFMQRLADVLCLRIGRRAPTAERSAAWLGQALFADTEAALVQEAVGQFDPGAAGGANSSPVGAAPSLVNPWSWVLLIEGSLLFASAAARRLGADVKGRAAMPFMVDPSPTGYASGAPAEKSRGEVWAPLWERPATLAEISHLVGEGRSEWRGRGAGTGLDMARATASLGVDRGIAGFERHVLLERNGLATVAVPAGRLRVRYLPEVVVAGDLDPWLNRVRGAPDKPAAVESAVRAVDASMFDLAARGGPDRLLEVLAGAASLEIAVSRSSGFRERARIRPLSGLAAADWLGQLDLSTAEMRLARALASMSDHDGRCLRTMLHPVARSGRFLEWSAVPAIVPGFGTRPVVEVLAAAHVRRAVELLASDRAARPTGGREERDERDGRPAGGLHTAFDRRWPARAAEAARLVSGDVDLRLLQRALSALMVLDWDRRVESVGVATPPTGPGPVVPAWWLLAPFFHRSMIKHHGAELRLAPHPSWPSMLVAGAVDAVVDEAVRRLRIARLDPPFDSSGPAGRRVIAASAGSGPELAAALLCPISTGDAAALLSLVDPPPIHSTQEDDE